MLFGVLVCVTDLLSLLVSYVTIKSYWEVFAAPGQLQKLSLSRFGPEKFALIFSWSLEVSSYNILNLVCSLPYALIGKFKDLIYCS